MRSIFSVALMFSALVFFGCDALDEAGEAAPAALDGAYQRAIVADSMSIKVTFSGGNKYSASVALASTPTCQIAQEDGTWKIEGPRFKKTGVTTKGRADCTGEFSAAKAAEDAEQTIQNASAASFELYETVGGAAIFVKYTKI